MGALSVPASDRALWGSLGSCSGSSGDLGLAVPARDRAPGDVDRYDVIALVMTLPSSIPYAESWSGWLFS